MIQKALSLLSCSFLLLVFLFLISSIKAPVTCAYVKGDCTGSSSICYTGTKGADFAPGYQCGDAKGYVYGNGGNQQDNSIPRCNDAPHPGLPDGFCCDAGAAPSPLPPHKGYDLGTNYSGYDCAQTSICYTGSYNNPLPGEQCGNLKGWIYGHDSSNKVPACAAVGIGNAVCCDVGTPVTTPIPPNPCPSQLGQCTNIDTALGNIDVTNAGAFIKTIFALLLSLSGGIALILIIISGYRIMIAQGDPEKIKGAREMLTSAIIGLLFMIFSVSILQILGVDILHIPGFK